MVFCALAVARDLQNLSGKSIKKILDTLEPIREGIVEINGHQTTIPAEIPDEAAHLLQSLKTPH